jgi:hypothetical protein
MGVNALKKGSMMLPFLNVGVARMYTSVALSRMQLRNLPLYTGHFARCPRFQFEHIRIEPPWGSFEWLIRIAGLQTRLRTPF